MRKSRKNRRRSIIGYILVAALTLVLCFSCVGDRALALLNEEELVRFSVYSARNNIEVSTLFIGTYLINIEALNDELYEKALNSASESDQMNMYYKSEVGEGLWYDVTEAESLKDIMNSALSVPESELADLFVQYYVGADGIMIDVLDGREVNPFDVPNPYDLSKLAELEPLWTQYTNSAQVSTVSQDDYLKAKNSETTGNKRVDVYTYQLLSAFFSMDLRDSTTDGYDKDLKRLYQAYKSLKRDGKNEEADIVYSLMASVDAARRSVVMNKLAMLDENALAALYDLSAGKYYTTKGNFKSPYDLGDISANEPRYLKTLKEALMDVNGKKVKSDVDVVFQGDPNVLSAIGDSMEKCQESYYDLESKALADADSVLGHAQYAFSRQVIDEISSSGAGNSIAYLRDVRNITESIVKNSESEIYLLDRSLLNLAESRYAEAVAAGASADYSREQSRGASAAALENILNSEMDDLEARRTELEFLIDAYKMRAGAADSLLYVKGCIEWTTGLYQSVPGDDFKARANGSLDSHISWLSETQDQIRQSDESLKSELDKLYEKKEELQRKRDQELDNNNLAAAKKYDDMIAAVDRDILDAAARYGKSADSELANKILNEALEELAKDAKADVTNAVAALNGLQAYDALEKLYSRLDAAGNTSGSEYRTGANADERRSNQILSDALAKLEANPDADVTEEISALYGMGAEDILNKLYEKLDELGNSSGAEYRPGTETLDVLAEQSLDDALMKLDGDPKADMSGAVALLKGLGNADGLKELCEKLDKLGNNSASRFRSVRDSVGALAEEKLEDTLERLAQNPKADASSALVILKAMGQKEAFDQLCEKLDDLDNNSGKEYRHGTVSTAAVADKILNDAMSKLSSNSKADVTDAVAALNEMAVTDQVNGQHAKENKKKLLDKLDLLNNTSGGAFRSGPEEVSRLAEKEASAAMAKLNLNPSADVSDAVALLKAMDETAALRNLADKLDHSGNDSGAEYRGANVSTKALADKILSDAIAKLDADAKADVTSAVAALSSLKERGSQSKQIAEEALTKLYEKLDSMRNTSGEDFHADAEEISVLAEKECNSAIAKVNRDSSADVSGAVALLKAMNEASVLQELLDKMDQAGNKSGSAYRSDTVTGKALADKILSDAMTKLGTDPKSDVTAAIAALSVLKEKDQQSKQAAEEALDKIYEKLNSMKNNSGDAFRYGDPSPEEIAEKILEDALMTLGPTPKADVTAAVAALSNMGAKAALEKLDEKLDELENTSGLAMRPGGSSGGSSGSGSGNGSGSGSEKGPSAASLRMDEDDIKSALKSAFGKSVENMDAEELATATAVASRFGREGSAAARTLAVSLADLMRSKNSKYLYNQYKEKNPEYVSLRTIGLCTDYRYYYDSSRRTATMTMGVNAMIFRSGSDQVELSEKTEKLTCVTVLNGDVYIAKADAETRLGCTSEYVPNTQYAICITDSMEGKVKDVLKGIME